MKSFRRRVQCLPPFPRKIMQLRAGFTGRCFVSGPFSSAKDTVNLKPAKLLFLTCSRRNAPDEFSHEYIKTYFNALSVTSTHFGLV